MADGDTPWFSTFEPELQTFVAAKGLDKMDKDAALVTALKGHQNAERLIGVPADQVVRLPKDAADPTYQAVYDRIANMRPAPTADQYKFDGMTVAEADAALVRDIAVKHRVSPEAAREFVAGLASRSTSQSEADANAREMARAANQVALRQHWGGHFDNKAFAATKVAEAIGFTPEVLASMAVLPAPEYVKNMEALASLSTQLNEAVILRGGAREVRDPTAGFTPEQAEAELTRLQGDPAWRGKYFAGDAETKKTWANLTSIIAQGRVQARTGAPQR